MTKENNEKEKGEQDNAEGEIIKKLGINIEQEDATYFLHIISIAFNNPDDAKEKIKFFSYVLDRIIPDEELTRIRSARFLFALENICFAFRKILEIEEFNIISELKSIAKEYFIQIEKDAEVADKMLQSRIGDLIKKIEDNESIDVKTAINIIQNLNILFNIEKENREFIPLISYSGKKKRKNNNE